MGSFRPGAGNQHLHWYPLIFGQNKYKRTETDPLDGSFNP